MQNTVPHPLLAAPRSDGKFLRVAFLFALTVHVIVLLIPWQKEPYVPQPEPVIEGFVLTPYDIEPPQLQVRNIVEIEPRTRKVPLPAADPEPEMLEPLSEEVYVDQPVVYDGETDELFLDRPEPPDPGIYNSWERDLVLPMRLESSADPEYPRTGRSLPHRRDGDPAGGGGRNRPGCRVENPQGACSGRRFFAGGAGCRSGVALPARYGERPAGGGPHDGSGRVQSGVTGDGSAASNRRMMSPAGSTRRMPSTLFPAWKKSL